MGQKRNSSQKTKTKARAKEQLVYHFATKTDPYATHTVIVEDYYKEDLGWMRQCLHYLAQRNIRLAIEHGGVVGTVDRLAVAGGELSKHRASLKF